jgi:hypothetical protein
MMTKKSDIPRVKYCQHHDMVWNSRTRAWKIVPADFIDELRHVDFPVGLVEWPCPRCRKQRDQEADQKTL